MRESVSSQGLATIGANGEPKKRITRSEAT